jgi:release factor glutamine methyltransferase
VSPTSDQVTPHTKTVGSLRRDLALKLAAGWGETSEHTAALDARLLVAYALKIDAGELAARDDQAIGRAEISAANALAERRIRGEPVARIIGEKEFWSLPFGLAPATMVPRPDTEIVVESALDHLRLGGRQGDGLSILDLGTGSGCILLALLSELPRAVGIGVDLAFGAAATARENAIRLGLAGRARFVAGDWTRPIAARFDVIVANPPYVDSGALPTLPREVIGFDPRLSLDGGGDGLVPYRSIVPELPRFLAPSGVAVVEFGPRQGEAIAEMAKAVGLNTDIRQDLAGRDRCFLLTLSEERRGKGGKNHLEKSGQEARV